MIVFFRLGLLVETAPLPILYRTATLRPYTARLRSHLRVTNIGASRPFYVHMHMTDREDAQVAFGIGGEHDCAIADVYQKRS